MERRQRNNELTMTTFHSRQSDWRRRVRKKANASTLQISVTNCPTKLHGHVHEGRKIQRNNVSSMVQKHGCKYCFYAEQALPLNKTRILRLAQISPLDTRSPARRPRDGRETSGKTSGEISRRKSESCPGNGRAVATAMPPNVWQVNSQGNLRCTGYGRAMSAPETCETTRNTVTRQPCASRATVTTTPRKTTCSNLNHDIQKL
jgi:hypothetical protein